MVILRRQSPTPETESVDMIKLNRIGSKLGLAGAVGVLLSIGMIANQTITERAVNTATASSDRQQAIVENALAAEVILRRTQLGGRNMQLARTASEVERDMAEMRQFKVDEEKQLDAAIALAAEAGKSGRLQKIKDAMGSYAAGVE